MMSALNVRQGIHIPFIKIRYLQCTETVPRIIIAIAGLLTSIWTNCILLVVCMEDNYYSRFNFLTSMITYSGQLSHFIVVVSCTVGLVSGLQDKIRAKVSPWLIVKILELIVLFIGSILLATGRRNFLGLMPVGIIFLLIGGYIFSCVLDAYQKMDDNPAPPENISVNIPDDFTLSQKPPSYDQFTNQQNIQS